MTIEELEAKLLTIPPTSAINRKRRAIILNQIAELKREQK
jgi:hypothetical protein